MSTITRREKTIKEIVLGKCWDYLHDNFHKFRQPVKIKVALALAMKDIPQEVKGDFTHVVEMPMIKFSEQPLEFVIGRN